MNGLSRRELLKISAASGLGTVAFAAMDFAAAQQGEQLLVVMWGAAWIEVSRKIVDAYVAKTGDKVAWELHAGGAMAIVAKIKPAWPRVNYNLISGWDPVFRAMIKEDWVEPVTLDEMPALKDIPPVFFQKNAKGRADDRAALDRGRVLGLSHRPRRQADRVDRAAARAALQRQAVRAVPGEPHRAADADTRDAAWRQRAQHRARLAVSQGTRRARPDRPRHQQQFRVHQRHELGRNLGRILQHRRMDAGAQAVSRSRSCPRSRTTRASCSTKASRSSSTTIRRRSRPPSASRTISRRRRSTSSTTGRSARARQIRSRRPIPKSPTCSTRRRNSAQYAYIADFEYMASQVDGWAKRWEQEIAPLIRRS